MTSARALRDELQPELRAVAVDVEGATVIGVLRAVRTWMAPAGVVEVRAGEQDLAWRAGGLSIRAASVICGVVRSTLHDHARRVTRT